MSRFWRPRNRRGDPIDPVPFVVSAGLAFLFAFSVGPIYGLTYGLSLRASLAASGIGFLAAGTVAYVQLVRRAPSVDAGSLPPGPRFERLLYVALGLGVLLTALTLPLL